MVDALSLFAPELYLERVILQLLLVGSVLMLSVLGHRQLVDHSLPRQEVGPPPHLSSLMQKLKFQAVETQRSLHLFAEVVAQHEATCAQLSQDDFHLIVAVINDRLANLLEELLDRLLGASLAGEDVEGLVASLALQSEVYIAAFIRETLDSQFVQVGLELLDRVRNSEAFDQKVHLCELSHAVIEQDLVCPCGHYQRLQVHFLVSEDASQLFET